MSIQQGSDLRVFLTGSFKVELSSGEDATPTSAKAQCLLALLVTSHSGSRSRSWLQSRLWSDRAPEQASGSLRQCLVQLKKSLEPVADIIEATRQKVTLDLSRVEIVTIEGEEFLEGMDIRDGEFEDWLRTARSRNTASATDSQNNGSVNPSAPPQARHRKISVKLDAAAGSASAANWLLSTLSDSLIQQLRETFSVDVSVVDSLNVSGDGLSVSLEVCQLSGSDFGVRMTLKDVESQLWANNKSVTMAGAPRSDRPEFQQLCNQLVEAVGDALFQSSNLETQCPDSLSRSAIRNLFSMRKKEVLEADSLFAKAFDLNARGLYLAWRAQSKTIAHVQRLSGNHEALKDESEALCAKALELEPNNSMVLATIANSMSQVFREHARGHCLAQRSVILNPSNPMGWWALSSTAMYLGKSEEALNTAVRANYLALTSPHRFWWDMQVFASSLMSGKLVESQSFAERCHAQNPESRVPLRYLIALYANEGREDEAVKMAGKLSALEPDFTIDRLVKDGSYPASLLRKNVGIDLDRVSALS